MQDDSQVRDDPRVGHINQEPEPPVPLVPGSEAIPLETMRVEVRARRWTMRVIALLLAGQTAILFINIWRMLGSLNWELEFSAMLRSMRMVDALLLGGLLMPVAVFDLYTAISMWLGQRGAWLRAMMVQGILLIFCLSSYVVDRAEEFVYLLMLTCIVLVLYLNNYDVRLSLTSRETENAANSG
jgi:branched-subunit amino acid transport protein AzlD